MSESAPVPEGPDLKTGVREDELRQSGMLVGHVDGEPVLLVSNQGELFAVGATCTHYSGPLGEGIVADGTIRCPWHHACFSLRTGEAVRAPALDPISCWAVERGDGRIRVTRKLPKVETRRPPPRSPKPETIVIIGAGAAGNAAAEMLRRRSYPGRIILIGAELDRPYDRPNLSKDYLAGTAQEEWIPLRSPEFYAGRAIELVLGTPVAAFDPGARLVWLADGRTLGYDRLLLATGAEPVRLDPAIHALSHVYTLRSLSDCRSIIAAAGNVRHAVVVGSSFIGLEVAASLRKRGLAVAVVSRDSVPFERTLGSGVGRFFQSVHEANGVTFHLAQTVGDVSATAVTLEDGTVLPAELVVVGIGVRPAVQLATQGGLAVGNGVLVNEYLETSAPGVFAAGDIAAWPDPRSGGRLRVEHWVVAERQGQVAARNMLGDRVRYEDVPFFWTVHHDAALNYVGHHDRSAQVTIEGSLAARDARVTYREGAKVTAIATVGRDRESLLGELALERRDMAEPSPEFHHDAPSGRGEQTRGSDGDVQPPQK
jgi:NADPH-dependent 2,4-dienoyl-CoA reductase/sulfur reductase-like enzyme/nitrite reductase/ring-hydroxylating ferredoxin subunit